MKHLHKLDSYQNPKKHNTIPANVLPNASEDLFQNSKYAHDMSKIVFEKNRYI